MTTPLERKCEHFVLRYKIASINIFSELLSSVVITLCFILDFTITEAGFGAMAMVDTARLCRERSESACKEYLWTVAAAYAVLVVAEIIGYALTMFILNARMMRLTLRFHNEIPQPQELMRAYLARPLQEAEIIWEWNVGFMVVSGALVMLCSVATLGTLSNVGELEPSTQCE